MNKPRSIKEAQEAIGIDWMDRREIAQTIPPAYSEFLGRQIIVALARTEKRPAAIAWLEERKEHERLL